ncbi:MAG: fluoride efflux transporter CrcB [Actinobacteria bacterium]|nr:fluoride efflux transporter CrcB [Actinomycetota bacterium]
MSVAAWAALLGAGSAGAASRFLLDRSLQRRHRSSFPWGTFAVNVSGSFALGLVTGASLYRGLGDDARTILGTGFCGAFTTFSTWTVDCVRLVEAGLFAVAARNLGASLAAGLLAAGAGLALMAR